MHIRIHFTFWIYLLCIGILSSVRACISVLLTLFIHESCHYAVSRIAGEMIECLELTPFGGIMTYKSGTSSSKGIKGALVHAAGPFGNYVFLLIIGVPLVQRTFDSEFLRCMFIANASMLTINLMPALPLDGGRIVLCIGYYFMPIAKLISLLSFSGVALGISGILFTVYGLIDAQFVNCSLLLISVYLMYSAAQCKKMLYAENLYALVHEQLYPAQSCRRLYLYQVAPHTRLLDLLPLLKQGICVNFLFIDEGEHTRELNEAQFCRALLISPASTVGQAYSEISKQKENTPEF